MKLVQRIRTKIENAEDYDYFGGGPLTLFSFDAYFGLGVTASVGFNWKFFINRVSEIYN